MAKAEKESLCIQTLEDKIDTKIMESRGSSFPMLWTMSWRKM